MPQFSRPALAAIVLIGGISVAAHAQVALVDFHWSSMGGSAAGITGLCGTDCVPTLVCLTDPSDSYTLLGSSMSQQSPSGLASRNCAFSCNNTGSAGHAGSNASVQVNINDPDITPTTTRWVFSHHMGSGAGVGCSEGFCSACASSSADGDTAQEWHLTFNLLGPTVVNFNHAQLVQRSGIGASSATWTFNGPSGVLFSQTLNTDTNPTEQNQGVIEQLVYAGQYQLDIYASTACSPFAGFGQQASGTTVNSASCQLSFTTYTCAHAAINPTDTFACPTEVATFNVTAGGNPAVSHQWQHETAPGSGVWSNLTDGTTPLLGTVSGAATPMLQLNNFGPGSPGLYRCLLTNLCGGTPSSPANLLVTATCCDPIDFNNDGLFPDTQDVDDFLVVFSGGPCSTGACNDIDFNNDGLFPDTQDINALLSIFSGGPCLI